MNGQNVPRPDNDEFKIRNFFIPKPGKVLFFIDFSGFELRLMTWKSGDEVMTELFNTGGDMHRRTASVMTGKPESEITKKERTDAKAGNFGISYGGTEHALQTTFKTQYLIRKSLDACLQIVNAVKNAYKRIPEYQRNIVLDAREKGYVQTIYGYIRMLPGINSPGRKERGGSERQAANTPIQGSAADIMKRAQNDVYDKIGEDTFNAREWEKEVQKLGQAAASEIVNESIFQHGHVDMIAQIHDEIIFEIDDNPQLVKKVGDWVKDCMEREPLKNFPVPIIADASVGYRWGDKNDFGKWIDERMNS
ncbi:DNA polymerase [Neobacillus sp. NPDC093127]|uniref:DNA polymerase n=1 Tax=Neobacillus sp. NPDC093127 TaxID=3364296 RepID=UPI00382A3143